MARSKVKSQSLQWSFSITFQSITVTFSKFQSITITFKIQQIYYFSTTSITSAASLHSMTPAPCTPTPPNNSPYKVSTSYTLWFPRDTAWTHFFAPPARTPTHPDTTGVNNTCTAIKGLHYFPSCSKQQTCRVASMCNPWHSIFCIGQKHENWPYIE